MYRALISLYVYSTRLFFFFFFNDTATTEIYTLSLHDALPICIRNWYTQTISAYCGCVCLLLTRSARNDKRKNVMTRRKGDRKSTRLNSSHGYISYAVFCLKKKKTKNNVLPSRRTYFFVGLYSH